MRQFASQHSQRGITLFVGMIMLVLITVMVTSAFMLSNSNLKAVGNMQAKEESIAAANKALEQVIGSPFSNDPKIDTINVDINSDGTPDYQVEVSKPVCIRASIDTFAVETSIKLDPDLNTVTSWNTLWDIEATAKNLTTGDKTTVSSGVRVLLTEAQKDEVCK